MRTVVFVKINTTTRQLLILCTEDIMVGPWWLMQPCSTSVDPMRSPWAKCNLTTNLVLMWFKGYQFVGVYTCSWFMTWVIWLAWRGLNTFSWEGGYGMSMPLFSKLCNEVTCMSLSWKFRVYNVDSVLVHSLVTKTFALPNALWNRSLGKNYSVSGHSLYNLANQ